MQVRKKDGKCPTVLNEPGYPTEFTPYPLTCKAKESSKLQQPIIRQSIVIDKKLAGNISFLSFLSAELDSNSSFSLVVLEQAAGSIDMQDVNWRKDFDKWKSDNTELLNDPEICYLFAIFSFVQKNIVRKKYVKYSGKAQGGAYGLNIGGELSTGTDQNSLDIRIGLIPIVLKRPSSVSNVPVTRRDLKKLSLPQQSLTPSKEEFIFFRSLIPHLKIKKLKSKTQKEKISTIKHIIINKNLKKSSIKKSK